MQEKFSAIQGLRIEKKEFLADKTGTRIYVLSIQNKTVSKVRRLNVELTSTLLNTKIRTILSKNKTLPASVTTLIRWRILGT